MRTKRDKIFDNKFDETEYETQSITFKVDATYDSEEGMDDSIHSAMLFEKVEELIKNSKYSEFATFSDANDEKLSKSGINEIYLYISQNVKEYTKTEIFSVLSDYLDIAPNKFYNSLSNTAKEELILELDKKLNILDKKGIRKLF
jgi:F0F1-type ATP synthase gamma subunit